MHSGSSKFYSAIHRHLVTFVFKKGDTPTANAFELGGTYIFVLFLTPANSEDNTYVDQ